jgi:ketol-acid reductoisomerase
MNKYNEYASKVEDLVKVYFDEDANISVLKDKTIAIIGYGNQGRAQALNMRDSKVKNIIVGNIKDESWDVAESDGFEVYPMEKAAELADIIFMCIPDEVHGEVYERDIKDHLKEGKVLNFAHGYSITYGFVNPPPYVDVIMVAPRMIGKGVRETYKAGIGFPAFVAVHQNYSGKAKEIALAIAKAIGATKYGVYEVSFDEETIIDIFHEQLVGVAGHLWLAAIDFITKKGVDPKIALMEFYISGETGETWKAIGELGFFKGIKCGSETAQYGIMTRGPLILPGLEKIFEKIYNDIESGVFAKELSLERSIGRPFYNRWWKKAFEGPISKAEEELFKDLRKGPPPLPWKLQKGSK